MIENCPVIANAKMQFHLPFEDPKKFDNSQLQQEYYLLTNKQIAGEIHYIFKRIAEII